MNIFFKELKSNRKSLIFWSIGMFLMVVSGMAKFSAISATAQSTNDLMNAMPKALQSILGFGFFDLSSAVGYYGMLFIYIAIMAAIHASMLGADIIAKEEKDRTSEFLFVKPVSRTKVVSGKLLLALTNVIIINLVALFSSLIIVNKYSRGEPFAYDILILMAGMFVMQLIFLFFGSAVAALSRRPRTATSIVTAWVLSTFILSVAIDMTDKIANLKYLTPFKYFDARNIIRDQGLDPFYIGLSAVLLIVMIFSTYFFYHRRDLST